MDRADPRDPRFAPAGTVAGKVVPYDIFLRARAKQDADARDAHPAGGKRSESDAPKTPGETNARLTRVLHEVREEFRRLPDVRPAKVREARRRIRSGFYERPEVLAEIVRRILAEEPDLDDGEDCGGER